MKIRLNKATCATLMAGALTLSVAPLLSATGSLAPNWLSFSSALAGPKNNHGHDHDHDDDHKPATSAEKLAKPAGAHDHEDEGLVHMTPAQAASHGIEAVEAGPGVLSHTLTAPGVIAADSDRIGRIAARVVGTVAVLNKRLGDQVEKDEIVAELDSREVAEARSEYFAALTNLDLQKTLFAREQELWNRKVSAEQQYLRARNTLREVELRVDLAIKKLAALGLGAPEAMARMSGADAAEALQRYPLRAPLSGRVVERRVDLGAPVGGEGHEKELYVIADLSKVWVDLAIPADDLSRIHEGQEVRINVQNGSQNALKGDAAGAGKVIFVSPMLSPDTRSARVIAELDNAAMRWRPGAFVTARVTVGEEPVALRIPRDAVQRINGQPAVFVETPDGFRVREVGLGKEDSAFVAVTSGLKPGEHVAARNAFLLKAELGKAEAEHAH